MRIHILLILGFFALAATAEELPYTSFGHLPIVDEPEISPDGKHVALIVNSDEGPSVNVAEFGSREMTPVARLKFGVDRIDWIEWANDERLLIASSESMLWFGDRIRVARLFSVDRDGGNLQHIRRRTVKEPSQWTVNLDTTQVIDWLVDDPRHILMQLYDELDEAWSVFKVNIYENDFEKLFVNSYDVRAWATDGRGNVVFGAGYENDMITTWYRPDSESKWQKLYERQAFVDEYMDPIIVNGDKAIVFSDHELGRDAIWRYDISTGEYEELLFAADGYDVARAILSVDRTEVIGASYYEDSRVDRYFSDSDTATADLVAKSFANYQTSIVTISKDRKRMIVRATRDDTPPKYFWLDLGTGKGGIWFSQYPYLEKRILASKQAIKFEASDGLPITGYLTLPPGVDSKKAKTIVFPHGGPQGRDYKDFDPYVQFFANRGYAVLQVNFRGSTGFGNKFEVAGYREWGQAMQQDVYDAIDWLAAQNIVDTDHMCVIGISYGGYVALTAAFQQPKRFDCIVSMAGVSDLRELAATESKFSRDKTVITKLIGDPTDDEDKERMDRASAIKNLNAIDRPILLIHGTYDTQVNVKQSQKFYRMAERLSIDIEYIELERGTHYFDENVNRQAVFEALDRFLDKHL